MLISQLKSSQSKSTGIASLLLLCLIVSACGFKLRGTGAGAWPQHLQSLQLRFDNGVGSDFKQSMRNTLMDRYGVKLIEHDAPELVISGVQTDRRVLSLSATGKASEYLLRFRVSFAVNSRDGKPLIEQQTVKLQRDFSFDNTNVLAKEIEEARLSEQMQIDAVRRILSRVIVLSKKR